MKKYTPYILPLVVIAVVFVLVYRWYSMRTERMTSSLLEEGVIIENLSEEELQETLGEASDFQTVNLTPVTPSPTAEATPAEGETATPSPTAEMTELGEGVIRYDIDGDRLRFSVIAQFPESEESYQVFLRDIDGTVTRHAFTLDLQKGGYIGSAAVSAEILPVDVIVARGGTEEPGEVVQSGRIEAPSQE